MVPSISTSRVVIGGVVAGCVIVALDFVARVALGERTQRDLAAWLPSAADVMHVSGTGAAASVALKVVIGVVLVWLGTNLRPELGSATRRACWAALGAWLLGAIFFSDFALIGMLSPMTYVLVELFQLAAFVVAAVVGVRVAGARFAPLSKTADVTG
jgi:hypothetical protein